MYVRVVVYPQARRELVTVLGEQRLEIQVREPAIGNAANRRVTELVAQQYDTVPKMVSLVSGHHSSRKIYSVPNNV